MYSFSLLVNSFDLDTFITRLRHTYTVFSSQRIDSVVASSIKQLENLFQELGTQAELNEVDNSQVDSSQDEDNDIDNSDVSSSCKENPFLIHITAKLIGIHTSPLSQEYPVNPLYSSNWVDILESKWLPHTPLWTSLLRGTFYNLYNKKYKCITGNIDRYMSASEIEGSDSVRCYANSSVMQFDILVQWERKG